MSCSICGEPGIVMYCPLLEREYCFRHYDKYCPRLNSGGEGVWV